MEKAEIETVNNSEASCSVVPRVNSTDVEEMSKEKEEELLHSEEDDDEETLSDDSLRLRLSSDEDFEQEDVMKNGKNVAKLNSQTAAKKSIIDTTTEKTACSDMQKKVLELDSEESEKKHSTAVKARENTALSLDERTSKNKLCKIIKLMQDTTAEKTACSDMQKKVLELDSEESEKKHSTENENMEQKRTTAKSTEEIIRKEYLKNSDSSDSNAEEFPEFVTNCKQNRGHFTSRTSLKRNCLESETFNGNIKKMKMNPNSKENKDVTQLSFIENFFRRDFKEKIPKLTQGELEELLIQKIVETIAMRSEIGQLREQARISERNQELLRGKMGQLIKQIKEFEIVLSHNEKDRRTNPDKIIPPIKINRSVALQVNYITEHGRHNSRQAANLKLAANTTNSNSPTPIETNNPPTNPKRNGIKTRSPRSIVPAAPKITQSQTVPATPVMSTVTPTALVVAKSLETPHTLTLSNQPTTIQPVLSTPQPSPIQTSMIQSQPHKAIVINGKIQNQINHPTLIAPKPRSNDLIDLTDEEEKNKLTTKVTTATTPLIEQLTTSSKPAQTYQRIIQAIPANVAITTQPTNIKMITTNQQSTSTLVNNINPPRLAYVMQSGNGSPRPVLIASNSNQQVQIRPVNATNRQQFPTVTYKPVTGVSTISNGPMRVLATPVLSSIKINKHPAPLPDIPNYAPTPGWKLPPPAPSLKISKVSNGIVLSWNMNLTEKYADIASYQLYAYQEVAGMSPNTSLWKKVGDVRALPLPMACTLTQFSEGNNYYFAVRAVDTHSRKGQYSIPGNISL
ncbi:activating transcription factor 7-interacting protein 1 isoform X5 [Cardiocondyla obscurior]|uniref:activating transcription factor 7-interacting protein 1 isoform X5 n=1 Tax=Cardiocondyla obscurior TaxID=286306 RepID=UPI003965837B